MRCVLPLLLIYGLLLSHAISLAAAPHSLGKVPIIHIDAKEGSPLEVGLEIGHQSKALYPDIEQRYDKHLATILSQTAFNDILRESLPRLLKHIDKAYQQELQGVANAWMLTNDNKLGDGLLSLDEYRLLNLLPDISLAANGVGFGVLGKASGENGPIVGRNLDWTSTPELRSLQAITVYQYSDHAIVNIGFAGIISVLTGFNDRGLFLAHFNAEPYSTYRGSYRIPEDARTSVFDLRNTLETTTSTQQAARYLTGKFYGYSNNILMADKKTIQVLEYPQGGTARVRNWNSSTRADKPWEHLLQIAVVDCHVLASLPNNCRKVKDVVRWQRLGELAQFSTSQPADAQDVSNILFDTANDRYEIFSPHTLQSMMYLPANGRLYLYVTPINGAHSASPIHQIYPDLLPTELRNREDKISFDMVWLTWLLLLILLGAVLWMSRTSLQNFVKR